MRTQDFSSVESRRRVLQSILDARKTAAERNRLGQCATPPALASELVKYAAQFLGDGGEPIHFCDPAIGTGTCFSALLSTLPHARIGSATGIEIDPVLGETARELWSSSGLKVIIGDFLCRKVRSIPQERPNLIVTNPPYVRHHHLTRERKSELRDQVSQATALTISGLAGLHAYFFLLASDWMADGGLAVWLLPAGFMDVNYGSVLRRYLTERVSLITVHRFDPADIQFRDALVSSSVVVFRKRTPQEGASVRFSYGASLARPERVQVIPLRDLRQSRKWTAHPMSMTDVHRQNDHEPTAVLGDLFRIQRGIATGANSFFILPRGQALSRGLPARYLKPVLPGPRALATTVIERDSDGYPAVDPQLTLIDCDLPPERVAALHPALWDYLQSGEQAGVSNAYLVSRRNPWYRQEYREPAPFLCTYMGRGVEHGQPLRFLWNRSDALTTNRYLLLYPADPLAAIVHEQPALSGLVLEILQEIAADGLYGEGRVYGGALHKIEPSELSRVSAASLVNRIPGLQRQLHLRG